MSCWLRCAGCPDCTPDEISSSTRRRVGAGHVVEKEAEPEMGIRNIAAKVAQAKARGGGNFLNPGEGVLVVLGLKDGGKPEFHEGDTFVAELLVESCNGFKGLMTKDGKEKPAGNPVGSVTSYVQQLEQFPDVAYTNTKTFILALMGETDETVAEQSIVTAAALAKSDCPDDFKKMCAEIMKSLNVDAWTPDCEFSKSYNELVDRKKNPARGMRIKYSTYEKDTRDQKTTLTLPRWEPITQGVDEIKAMRTKLDGAAPAQPPAK